jgi:hypothetical protein
LEKIVSSGVPDTSLQRILNLLKTRGGQASRQDVYRCKDKPPESVKPCEDSQRLPGTKDIQIIDNPRYAIIVDFARPSTQERFFLVDFQTGNVRKFLTTHGRGSGKGQWAHKFSNIKNSSQSSLGLYQTGEIYRGAHGETVRMYGLETSNNRSYVRDIVLHEAHYARASFIKKINPNTGLPYDRLGLSWGCPAISPEALEQLMPLFKSAPVVVDLYHPDLMNDALSGAEVQVPEPSPVPIPGQPTPRPTPTPAPTGTPLPGPTPTPTARP